MILRYLKKQLSAIRCLSILIFLIQVMSPCNLMAQTILNLPAPGEMVLPTEAFTPALIKGLSAYTHDPFRFDFIVHPGEGSLTASELESEAQKMIDYFMAALTIPESEMWVNLSPYEQDRIMAEGIGQTEMGRDMLAQDYLLKQLTASLIHPEQAIGEAFWDKIYAEALKRYGTTDIPVDVFNKVWIIPKKAQVYVHAPDSSDAGRVNAFVIDSYLQVLTDTDYLALEQTVYQNSQEKKAAGEGADLQSEVVREVLIPAIEREVNEGSHFAPLRQMFNAMILASWYKKALRGSFLESVYLDQNKTQGIEISDTKVKQEIYAQYVKAFEKGICRLIKEEYDEKTKSIVPRKYFSGGIRVNLNTNVEVVSEVQAQSKLSAALPGSVVFSAENAWLLTPESNSSDENFALSVQGLDNWMNKLSHVPRKQEGLNTNFPVIEGVDRFDFVEDVDSAPKVDDPARLAIQILHEREEGPSIYKVLYQGEIYYAKKIQHSNLSESELLERNFIDNQIKYLETVKEKNIPNVNMIDKIIYADFGDGRKSKMLLFENLEKTHPGRTLLQLKEELGGKVDQEIAVNIVLQLAEILSQLHALGIIHGDIKEDNVWFTDKGKVILFDQDFMHSTLDEFLSAEQHLMGHTFYQQTNQISLSLLDNPAYLAETFSDSERVKGEIFSMVSTFSKLLFNNMFADLGLKIQSIGGLKVGPDDNLFKINEFKAELIRDSAQQGVEITAPLKEMMIQTFEAGESPYATMDAFIDALRPIKEDLIPDGNRTFEANVQAPEKEAKMYGEDFAQSVQVPIQGPLAEENRLKRQELEAWMDAEFSLTQKGHEIITVDLKEFMARQPRGGWAFGDSVDYLEKLKQGNVLAFTMGSNQVNEMLVFTEIIPDFLGAEISVDGNPLIGENLALVYDLREMLKNAIYHGNRLNGTLPIYIYVDQEKRRLEVFDLNNKEMRDVRIEAQAKFGYHMQGDGVGIKNIREEGRGFQVFDREGIFSDGSDNQIATRAVVTFYRNLIFDQGAEDAAQSVRTEIQGPLAQENLMKQKEVKSWLQKEFAGENKTEVNIVEVEAEEFLKELPLWEASFEEVESYIKNNQMIQSIIAGDVVGFTIGNNDVSVMEKLYFRLKEFLRKNIYQLEGSPNYLGNDIFMYDIEEMLKNAFFHGNRLNGTLPVYFRVDTTENKIYVIDLYNQEEMNPEKRKEALNSFFASKENKSSQGEHHMSEVLKEYQTYDRKRMSSENDGRIIGTMAVVSFKPKVVNRLEKNKNLGGIDFHAAHLDFSTSGNMPVFDFPKELLQIKNADIQGIRPVILQAAPISDIPFWIGAAAHP